MYSCPLFWLSAGVALKPILPGVYDSGSSDLWVEFSQAVPCEVGVTSTSCVPFVVLNAPFWASIGYATRASAVCASLGLYPDALGLGLHCRPCLG